jgi:DNA-binding transcriptional MerR regulator
MTLRTFTIGELCAEFNVTPRTLRFYEYKELLAPIRQDQRRIFTHRDRARLKLILRGKRFGFTLDEIKDLLDLYDVDRTMLTQIAATMDVAKRHHKDLIARRDELNDAIAELEEYMAEGRRILAGRSGTGAAA